MFLFRRGQNIADANRQIGVSEVTYYRWRQEFGGLKTEQVKRLKELETENIAGSVNTSRHSRRRPPSRVGSKLEV